MKRKMSQEARKKISEAQKKRWAKKSSGHAEPGGFVTVFSMSMGKPVLTFAKKDHLQTFDYGNDGQFIIVK